MPRNAIHIDLSLKIANSYQPKNRYLDITNVNPSDQSRLKRTWRNVFPFGVCYEFKQLMRLALPIAFTSLFCFTLGPVSIAFCGHLGKTELAAVGLAMSLFNVAGMFVILGLMTASDTIFAQTFGSESKGEMGLQFTRAIFLITLCCIPCSALFICSEPILLLLGQNPIIAKLSAKFLVILIPALVFNAWGQVFLRYLQTQNSVYAPLFIMVLTNGLNALLHYVLIYHTNLGLNASAVAQAIAYLFQDIFYLIYVQCSKSVIKINTDLKVNFLEDWGGWFKLAIPGLLMISIEWTIFEIGGFVAGSIGDKELAVQTVLISMDTISYTLIPYGFGTATSIRVGQYLGAGVENGPRSSFSVALLIIWAVAPVYFITCVALRGYLPLIFTSDKEVISYVSQLIPLTSAFQILDGTNGVCSGVLKGSGLQKFGALVNFSSLYIIGAPLALCLVYLAKMSIHGIWIGLITGTSIQGIFQLIICYRINWRKQVELAALRVKTVGNALHSEMMQNTDTEVFDYGSSSSAIDVLEKTHNSGGIFESEKAATGHMSSDSRTMQKQQSTKKLLGKRAVLIFALLLLLFVSITCQCVLKWSDIFGIYCVYENGTFVHIPHPVTGDNCTVVIP